MWLELPVVWIGLLNGLGIPLLQLGISWAFTRMPRHWFDPSSFPFSPWGAWESAGMYERLFGVGKWKQLLPDGASWFGGFAKKRLRTRERGYLEVFRWETCRGEAAHWAQAVALSVFLVWTPMPWAWVIVAWAVGSNLPCIILQRQNRRRIEGILARREGVA